MSNAHELLGPYFDGELSPGEKTLVEQHLTGCPECRERLEQLARVSSSIRSMPREPMPADLRSAILRRGRPEPRARLATTWRLTTLAAAAVAIIVAVTVWRANPPPPADRVVTEEKGKADGASRGSALDATSADGGAGAPAPTGAPDAAAPREASRPRLDESRTRRLEADRRKSTQAGAIRKDAPVREPASASDTDKESAPSMAPAPPSAPTPAAPPQPQPQPPEGKVIARYTATVVLEGGLPARLTAIIPKEPSRQLPEPTAKSLSAQSALSDDGGPVITFLVQADASGRILAATTIGARTHNSQMVESARALLVGSTLTPYEAGRAMSVVVEVKVPAS